jgi:hypothetical protein
LERDAAEIALTAEVGEIAYLHAGLVEETQNCVANHKNWLAIRSSHLIAGERRMAVRQGFEPWIQLLGRITV